MNPRSFLNFFKTRSGKLLLFALLLAAGLILYHRLRGKTPQDQDANAPGLSRSESRTNQPQLVETVERQMERFRPPAPKPETKTTPATNALTAGNKSTALAASAPEHELMPPISLFADTVSQQPEPKTLSADYAPYGRLIPCETVTTVDSSSIRTPIIGFVTEDIYHAGRLIIPAGTEVHGTAATDHVRDRLSSGTAWTLVWQTGEELRLQALALDREFDSDTNHDGWGITDGSAGLRGRLLKSDELSEIKLFAATFLSGAADALTEKQETLFGPINSPSLNNAPLQGAQDVLKVYAQRIMDSIQKDGFYVRVPSGTQFYLYVLQTIDRDDARLGDSAAEPRTDDGGLPASVPPVLPKSLPAQTSIHP